MSTTATELIATPLYEGTFSVGLDKKFNPIDRQDPPAKGALKLSINPFLIRGPERNYLFDVGIGDFGIGTDTDTIKGNLEEAGLTNYDITDIFASHLHFDHIGGLAGRSSGHWELTFPEAKLWVSGDAWQQAIGKDTWYDEEKTEFLHFVDAKADLHFLEAEEQPYSEVTVRRIGGHTEFSHVLLYDDGSQRYLMAGDVLATGGEVNRKFAAKYDYDGKASMKRREELTRLAYEDDYIIMGYHDSRCPLFRLTDWREDHGYTIEGLK